MGERVPWSVAMARAALGPAGFYRRPGRPADHFRTSVTAAPTIMAAAVARLVDQVARAWDPAEPPDVVDLGAGGGELLIALADLLPDSIGLHGVDVGARPPALPSRATWSESIMNEVGGIVVAHEYLDDHPIDVVEVDDAGELRLVLVDVADGTESLDRVVNPVELAWLARWWPLEGAPPGTRAELGLLRDHAWSAIVERVRRGLIIAVDYGHDRSARPPLGTLTGYRQGRLVPPVPDGSCNLTAHVALDACAAAGRRAGAGDSVVLSQTAALRSLGITAERPALDRARTDPAGYLADLARAGQAAELLDPAGLGGFGWLIQSKGVPLPAALTRSRDP